MRLCALVSIAFVAVPLGCSDESVGAASGTTTTTTTSGAGGAGGGSGGSGGQAPDPTAVCGTLGLPSRPFQDAPSSTKLYDLAADFTVPTEAGDWQLSAHWSGCDSYLFVQDEPKQNQGWPKGIWERDFDKLLGSLPKNVHVFFVSVKKDQPARDAALAVLHEQVDKAYAKVSPDDVAWWTERLHFVTAAAGDLGSWVGPVLASPGWGAAVDRLQRIRYIGSYADEKRFDASQGWFAPNLKMVANEARYYDFEAKREDALAAQDATVVPLWSGEKIEDPGWAGARAEVDVTLPDAATMAGFDSLGLDLFLDCVGDGELGECPAWDYIVDLRLCDEVDPSSCVTEIGRWITTYHREGRWVHDVSGFLPMLASGGARRFSFYSQQPYEVHLSLRLGNEGKAARPVETTLLWSGSVEFNEVYNDAFMPKSVPIPADAKKVELVTALTGHGMSMPGNCAEFCDTTHTFTVDGTPFVRDFPGAGTPEGCMEQVSEGTVPNQYGTWWYGRSGWCPGKEVPLVATDITDAVTPGTDAVIEYAGLFAGKPYTGDSWRNIDLSAAIVVSK